MQNRKLFYVRNKNRPVAERLLTHPLPKISAQNNPTGPNLRLRWSELPSLSEKILNLPVLLDLLVYLQALADLADPEKERNCSLNL